MGNSDDDEEEDEIIVYANFEEGAIEKEIFQQPDLKVKIIGLESRTPILQLGETIFKGEWNDTIGTKVLFEEDPSPTEPVDPVFNVRPPKMLKYKCMSTKSLELSRIFLKPRNSEEDVKEEPSTSQTDEVMPDEVLENEDDDWSRTDVIELVNSTVNPDESTELTLKNIMEESVIEADDS